MAIPLYLAMTGVEVAKANPFPCPMAWLSCLFSPYGTGLSNLPKSLPADSLLLLSDRTPIYGHDPRQILEELEGVISQFSCCGLLLDFAQQNKELEALVSTLLNLPCKVAVSEAYAKDLSCPVFLPPVPPDRDIGDHLAPWKGREIWLEVALDAVALEITEQGAHRRDIPPWEPPPLPFYDEGLCCHYAITLDDSATFYLQRKAEDLEKLLTRAEPLGVTKAIGLYQELG